MTGAKRRTQDFAQHLKRRSTATVEFLKTKELTQIVNNVCMFVPSVLVMHTVAVLNQYVFMHFCNFLRIYTQILYITLSIYIYIYVRIEAYLCPNTLIKLWLTIVRLKDCGKSKIPVVLVYLFFPISFFFYVVPLTQCGLHSAADLLALEAADKEAFERSGVVDSGGEASPKP